MSGNNDSILRHSKGEHDSYDSDASVDSKDGTVVVPNSVQAIVSSCRLNELSDAMTLNSIRVKDSSKITVGDKNTFLGPVTFICDPKSVEQQKLSIQLTGSGKTSKSSETGGICEFISRGEWLAKPPKKRPTPLVLPATKVVIQHTATDNVTTKVINFIGSI